MHAAPARAPFKELFMSSTSLLRGGLLLAALLGAHVQAADSLVVCTEASPEGFDIVQYTAATTADASFAQREPTQAAAATQV